MLKEWKTIETLFPLLKPHLWLFTGTILLGVLAALAEGFGISLFIPFLQGLTQSPASAHQGSQLLRALHIFSDTLSPNMRNIVIPLIILAAIVLKNILIYINLVLSSWLFFSAAHWLLMVIFNQLLTVSYSFLDSSQSGKIFNTIDVQTWKTCDALALLTNIVIGLCTIVVFTFFLLLISWQLTLLVTVALFFISSVIQHLTQSTVTLSQQAVQASNELGHRVVESLNGMRLIRSYGRESYERKRFEKSSRRVRLAFVRLQTLSSLSGPLSEILSVALLVAILVFVLHTRADLPVILTFIFILYRLQPYMKRLDSDRASLMGLTGSIEDVMALLNCKDKPYIQSGYLPFRGLQREIRFEGVSFTYDAASHMALADINLSIPSGKVTAIVGPSGSGKSTLIGLLCRFYDVSQGTIYVDDQPLPLLDLQSWRSRIAIVSQDVHTFNTTIAENIAYGRLDAQPYEIIAAAQQANAHEFICNLPQGYETLVGDRGVRLSGGQRQRIALARAMIRNPDILILDEATNALDSESETLIQEAIDLFSRDRTVIIIAHRLSTIETADQIVVLEAGRIVEQGILGDLLQLNGLFAKLHRLQYRV